MRRRSAGVLIGVRRAPIHLLQLAAARAAARGGADVRLDERGEALDVAPVRPHGGLGAGEEQERRVPGQLDARGQERLDVVGGRVDLGDDDARVPGVPLAERVPRGRERLAVAAPRRVQLDEDGRARAGALRAADVLGGGARARARERVSRET